MHAQPIILVGPMGAGKTTIGRLLAELLRRPFFDTDKVIEERCGADIAWIFDVEGEGRFRDRETAVLEEMLAGLSSVVATGGGAVVREKNRKLIRKSGIAVYLRAEFDELIERTSKDKKRPLLQVENPQATMKKLLDERDSYYQEVANIVIPTHKKNPKSLAQQVANTLDERFGVKTYAQ